MRPKNRPKNRLYRCTSVAMLGTKDIAMRKRIMQVFLRERQYAYMIPQIAYTIPDAPIAYSGDNAKPITEAM